MEAYFRELSEKIFANLKAPEVLLLNFEGEDSDFVRFNHGRIRQAGRVRQHGLRMDLVAGQKQTRATLELSGDPGADLEYATAMLSVLRAQFAHLPEDPHLYYASEPHDTRHVDDRPLPAMDEAIGEILSAATGHDLVGAWAGGEMLRGFANSLGQFNWHSTRSFNFDWSMYVQGDKAVKQNYAGFEWNPDFLRRKIDYADDTLELMARKPVSLEPGRYRVFLDPDALYELMALLNWGGFGLKSHRTAQTPLLRMTRGDLALHPQLHVAEDHAGGLAPPFTPAGFIKPARVELISGGAYRDCLTGARSAREYDTAVNAAVEHPQSLEIAGGELHQNDVLAALDTGVFLSNLWYSNFSDRNNCRITGMTRFACLWVKNGKPVAPINVMRFDESLLHILGDRLEALTEEHEHIFDTSSYGARSQASARLPGALVSGFTFTL
jgi:predicted Zn-dependent protease